MLANDHRLKKMLFVFNPNSGKGQLKNSLMSILQLFSKYNYEVTVYPTKAALDGFKFIKENEGKYDLVVCSGGDGTLNETVAAIMQYNQENKIPIGYIPSGTTNDFATSLLIPKDMRKAAEHIVKGKPRKCDIGIFNGRTFNYIAAFGAFTDVSYETSQTMKNVLGHQAYILEGVKRLSTLTHYRMKVSYEDKVITDDFIYGMISNTKSVGGMKGLVGKEVKLNDGLFEVTLIKNPKNPIEFQQILTAFISQKMEDNNMMYTFKADKLVLESETGIRWTLDGENGGEQTKVEFSVAKEAIELIVRKRLEL